MHIIHLGWTKNISTSILAFDIAQFFSSLNYHLLMHIHQKAGLNIWIVKFFANYLINRKTNYLWNNFSSPIFNVYFRKPSKKSVSIISFVDDELFISQNKSFDISNSHLFCSYNVMTNLLDKFSLIVEHSKTEVFYFNRSHSFFNPLPLDLSLIRGLVLTPKNS